MPKGKFSANGGFGFRRNISEDVFYSTIYKTNYFTKKKAVSSLDDLKNRLLNTDLDKEACEALGAYISFHLQNQSMTGTEVLKEIKDFKKICLDLSIFLKGKNRKGLQIYTNQFLDSFGKLSIESKNFIHRKMLLSEVSLFFLKEKVQEAEVYFNPDSNVLHEVEIITGLKIISQINGSSSINFKTKSLVDPHLPFLLSSLVPIWKEITGRTIGFTRITFEDEVKYHLFAEWVLDFIEEGLNYLEYKDFKMKITETTVLDTIKVLKFN